MRKTRKLRVPDDVVALIRTMHPDLESKVRSSLQTIMSEPYAGKALKDELSGLRSFRVSRFRIIYKVSRKQIIEVVAIGPRQRIYEETFRIISREQDNPSLSESLALSLFPSLVASSTAVLISYRPAPSVPA